MADETVADNLTTEDNAVRALGSKTVRRDFLSCNPAGDSFFSIREGIPVIDALEMVSTFLSSAIEICESALNNDEARMSGMYYLMLMAKFGLDAGISGLSKET